MICMQLRKMRDDLGWTTQELAEKSQVPLPTVKKIMTQHTDIPSFDTVCRLVEAMGGSLDELAGFPLREAPESDNELLKQSMDAAQEAIRLCHQGLEEKNAELIQARSELEKAQNAYKEKNAQVESLTATLAEKELRLEGHKAVIRTKKRWLALVFAVSVVLAALLIGLLFYDYLHPNIGFLLN